MWSRWWTPLALLILLAAATTPAIAAVPVPDPAGTPKLTLHLTTGTGTENRVYLLLASGPPPAREVLLLDEGGQHAVHAVVTSDAGRSCTAEAPRLTGLGEDPWCVHLSGVAAGKSVSGVLAGPRSTIVLALTARHTIWWPLLAAFVALILAGFIAWLVQQRLPDAVTSLLLRTEKKRSTDIAGLADWADETRRNDRLPIADIVARLRWARRFGGHQIKAARDTLHAKLPDLPNCPLRTQSEAESVRDDIKREDLLTVGGDRANRADHLLQLVEQALEGLKGFREVTDSLIKLLPESETDARANAKATKESGERLAEGYLAESTIDRYLTELGSYLDTVRTIVDVATSRPAAAAPALAAPALLSAGVRASLVAAGRRVQSASATVAQASAALGALLLLTSALMVIAVGAVLIAQYLPNLTFGTFKDYASLIVAAFGSAQLAVILAALIQLKGPTNWYG